MFTSFCTKVSEMWTDLKAAYHSKSTADAYRWKNWKSAKSWQSTETWLLTFMPYFYHKLI